MKQLFRNGVAVSSLVAALSFSLCLALPALAQSGTEVAGSTTAGAKPYPAWAYPRAPGFKAHPDDGMPRHMPGSTATFMTAQARDLYFSPDWHPDDHPPMPEIVARGRKPAVFACGSCHRAEGTGGPENSSLAGLPAAYILQQLADFKSGARKSSEPQMRSFLAMAEIAKALTTEEMQAAAVYFSALKPKLVNKVVEDEVVPKTYIAGFVVAKLETGGTEAIGRRIVEFPVDLDQFEHRDSRSQFMVYAPVGSIAKGEALVKYGGDSKTTACRACHGPDLRGVGSIPGIAGRSPSYLVRQLNDFKQGTRAGVGSALMRPIVEKLTEEDMLNLAAYIASLSP